MAKNYAKHGMVLTHLNAGAAIVSGDVVVIGSILGIAINDIAATNGSGTVQIEGVFNLPKADGAVIAQGEMVMWDASAGNFDDSLATPASGDVTNAAIAMETMGTSTSATIMVKLNTSPGIVA